MNSSSQYRCGNGPVAHLAKEQVEGLLIPIVLAVGFFQKGYHLRTTVILRKASFFSSNTCSPTTLLISPSFLLGYLVQLEVRTKASGRPSPFSVNRGFPRPQLGHRPQLAVSFIQVQRRGSNGASKDDRWDGLPPNQ